MENNTLTSEMKMMNVYGLTAHPLHDKFFDDITGEDWGTFLYSVMNSGILVPIIVSETGVIISGVQRWKACKELGIKEIKCIMRHYNGDGVRMVEEMIACNFGQ